MNVRLIKTLLYRLSATLLAQVVSYVIFQSIEVNAGILLADTIQMGWYYIFDRYWETYQSNNPQQVTQTISPTEDVVIYARPEKSIILDVDLFY